LYRDPIKSYRALKRLLQHGRKVNNGSALKKGFWVADGYGWDMFHPLFPGKAFDSFFYQHLEEIMPSGSGRPVLRRLLVAITKKCPLQCAHCSEWDSLNQKDVLSLAELRHKIAEMVHLGVSQIVYSGGEPLNRFADLLALVEHFRDRSQWIYTSAYGLDREKAQLLRDAGLEGVAVSLDHHIPEEHNSFRNNAKAWKEAISGIQNCLAEGFPVALNICPQRDYIRSGGMDKFMELANELGVHMVNILEPRAVGHWDGEDVELGQTEKAMLESVWKKYNDQDPYRSYPIITYPGMARKKTPCGGGLSYLLLDYDGTLRPCPFCKTPITEVQRERSLCEA
ncbi:MAG: radical SAM protein, partial [Bdellovibrionales bacterium]|nr:radical SAM protein [Bdellovibrionales bacterium]